MNKVKHAEKPVNNEPRYKRVAALMIMICMAVIPWITYMKVVKLDSTASEYFQNSDGLSVDFFLYYKAFIVIFLGVLIACFIIGENIFPDNIIKETPVRSKSNRIMVIAVGIFIIMTVLSAVFSRYHATVRTGSPSEYESVYVLVMVSVIVIANVVSGGKLLETGKNIAVNETIDEVNSSADKFQLDDIRLEDNRLRIIGPDKELCIEVDNGTLQFTDGQGNLLDVSNSDDVIHFDNEGYSMVTITMNSYNQLVIDLGYDDTIEFYVSDNTFYGVGQNGSKITDVSRDKRWGRWLYPLFTGRGYAWANTLPMLGKTILIGHGAGTFAYYFKQNDYVGLLNTHGSTKFVIDKPHSMYLQTAMEEGCVALAAMLVIFTMVIWNYIVNYKCIESGYADNKKHNLASVAGAGFVAGVGFMIYGLVNDSMVTVNPVFWIILGICVSSVYGLKNN